MSQSAATLEQTATGRIWSDEQRAIFAWFKAEVLGQKPNLVVTARAGTGKTTTICEALRFAPETRILVAAFNTRIKDELARKLQTPNAEAKTLHAVGFACVRRFWENVRLEDGRNKGQRVEALVQAVCGGAAPDAIKRLVGKLCTKGREIAPHAKTVGELSDIMLEHDLLPDEEWEASGFGAAYVEAKALEAMELAASRKPAMIDFADMLYLPVRNGWLTKTYDLVVIDEAQDMTVTQLEIARGVCKGRICVVGDNRQAIYAFRGADSESLDRLKAELGAAELGLKTTYRCPRLIVEAAARIVPDYQAAPGAPEGEILSLPSIEALVAAAENTVDADGHGRDFILSRTNAPLAGVAMGLIRAKKRVRIQGRDIGAGLAALVRKLSTGKAAHSLPVFFERLSAWETREVLRAEKQGREDLTDGIRDKAETLRVVAEGATGPREVAVRLESLFADEGNGGTIVCSSVHKAKGLEAARVFILRPTLCPKLPKGKVRTPKQVIEEANIQYVAVTRAMQTLVWVEAK